MTKSPHFSSSGIQGLPSFTFSVDGQLLVAHVHVAPPENLFYNEYRYRFRLIPANLTITVKYFDLYDAIKAIVNRMDLKPDSYSFAECIGPIVGVLFRHDSDAMRFKLMLG